MLIFLYASHCFCLCFFCEKAGHLCQIILIMVYVVRHFVFAVNRLAGRQRLYYNDVITSEMKSVTVVVPMHNEEQVLSYVLDALLQCEYDREKLEIIPVNDNSTDKTKELLDAYHEKYAFIRPLHRDCEERGKPAGLNDARQSMRMRRNF